MSPNDVNLSGTNHTREDTHHVVVFGAVVHEGIEKGEQAEALESLLDVLPRQIVTGPELAGIAIVRVEIVLKVACVAVYADLIDNCGDVGRPGDSLTAQTRDDQPNRRHPMDRAPLRRSIEIHTHRSPRPFFLQQSQTHLRFSASVFRTLPRERNEAGNDSKRHQFRAPAFAKAGDAEVMKPQMNADERRFDPIINYQSSIISPGCPLSSLSLPPVSAMIVPRDTPLVLLRQMTVAALCGPDRCGEAKMNAMVLKMPRPRGK